MAVRRDDAQPFFCFLVDFILVFERPPLNRDYNDNNDYNLVM